MLLNMYRLLMSYKDDIIEAHCYVVITSESILMSKYIAESDIRQLIAGHFGQVGRCQLCMRLKMVQCEMSYIANSNSVWPIVPRA